MKTQFIGDFGGIHCVGKILFVGKYEKKGIAELVFVEHALELLSGFRNTLTIIGVNYEDDALGVLEICEECQQCRELGTGISTMSPKGSDLVLTADIPNSEADVLVFHGFDIKSYTD